MIEFKNTLCFAKELDKEDKISHYKKLFHFPKHNNKNVLYFTGNSLGLQPKSVRNAMLQELTDWANLGEKGHFNATNPWYFYHKFLKNQTANLVGANTSEVVCMNGLTVNLHLLFLSFYNPNKDKFKILCESKMFPSDRYVLESQVRLHGLNPKDVLIEVCPRPGEFIINEDDILDLIEKNKNELLLVFLEGVNYYTGQFFNLKDISAAAHAVGAYVGYDLAHAVGNVELQLHEWNVDFAAWCSYKYLNSGPGSVAGFFINDTHHNNKDIFKLQGWWGNNEETRFKMKNDFEGSDDVDAWQLSNAPIFSMVSHKVSLDIFDEVGIKQLCEKSKLLTSYLEFIIIQESSQHEVCNLEIITPANKERRGCQLSILTKGAGKELYDYLSQHGVFVDWREPDVIRIAPVPLYNSFEDVFMFGQILKKAISM